MAATGTRGRHVIVEYWGCSANILGDLDIIKERLLYAAKVANATVVTNVFHRFTPTGVSGVVVIEESHLSIHTWPEEGYAACDFYTCGDCVPEKAMVVLKEALDSKRTHFIILDRGNVNQNPSFKILDL